MTGLELPGGGALEVPAGANLALVGPTAIERVGVWGAGRAALMVSDRLDPLHPAWSVGDQVAAALGGTRRAARDRAIDLLESVGMPEPHRRVHRRPRQLSALDRQRAQLALVLAAGPDRIVLEDPVGGLPPADAVALAETLRRLWRRGSLTLVLGASDLGGAEGIAEEIILCDGTGVLERRRRAGPLAAGSPQASPGSSASSSST